MQQINTLNFVETHGSQSKRKIPIFIRSYFMFCPSCRTTKSRGLDGDYLTIGGERYISKAGPAACLKCGTNLKEVWPDDADYRHASESYSKEVARLVPQKMLRGEDSDDGTET